MQDDVDHRFPRLERQVLHRHRRRAEAGVVEQEIEPAAERLLGLREQALDVLGFAHVGCDRHHLAAALLGKRDGLVELFLAAAGDHHVPAVALQRQRRRAADPAAATCDERNLTLSHDRSP